MKKITVPEILRMKRDGERIAVLTAYGFETAKLLDFAGVHVLLVGDSVGMVEGGHETTLPVTLDEMIYHARSVKRGAKNALVVVDMPFLSYQTSLDDARRSAGRLVKEGFAEAVKLEGGRRSVEAICAIVDMDVPVMGHVGLTPQSVHAMGGYRVQGKGDAAKRVLDDALAVEEAGAFSIVLEGIPASLAKTITTELKIPTIGIGAGPDCDGQVLVLNDMLGLSPDIKKPKFVREYANLGAAITQAVKNYIKDVSDGSFPNKDESY